MIALFVLNHLSGKKSKQIGEKEASDLCEKWGFETTTRGGSKSIMVSKPTRFIY
jgi:hypothetical protein